MFYVYAIKSKKDGRIYVGLTENIESRINYHNKGWNTSTKGFIPWVLIYSEEAENRMAARLREKHFKSGMGKEWLRQNFLSK
jgi:putative endonuclease